MPWFMGIDIGSETTKGVIINNGKLKAHHLLPSGSNYRTAAEKLRDELLAKAGLSPEDILAGVHKALADKISSLVDRVGLEEQCAISGGGGLDIGLIARIEGRLGVHLLIPPLPQLVTALGAAVIAEEQVAGVK